MHASLIGAHTLDQAKKKKENQKQKQIEVNRSVDCLDSLEILDVNPETVLTGCHQAYTLKNRELPRRIRIKLIIITRVQCMCVYICTWLIKTCDHHPSCSVRPEKEKREDIVLKDGDENHVT